MAEPVSVRSSPDWCLVYRRPDEMGKPPLSIGIESGGPAWLHSDFWETWYAGRKEPTISALAAIGITERRPLS